MGTLGDRQWGDRLPHPDDEALARRRDALVADLLRAWRARELAGSRGARRPGGVISPDQQRAARRARLRLIRGGRA